MDSFTHRWRTAMLLVTIVAIAIARRASADEVAYLPHVRSFEPDLGRLVADGVRLSPTLRGLLERLDRSTVIVHLEYSLLPWPVWGRTMLVATRGDWRYLRIQIDCRLALLDRLAMIGHELQHAVEIAESPAAVDGRSVARLYQQIGFARDPLGRSFETRAAREMGGTIRRELLSANRGRAGQADRSSATARR